MIDLALLTAHSLSSDLLESTRSTVRVQAIVQLSLAPAFLLAGIGAVMNVMTNRLIWVANRIETIREREADGRAGEMVADLPSLEQRRLYAQAALMFSTAAALVISIVIALLFVSAFIRPQIGTLIAIAWIVTMIFLVLGLGCFALEARTAARRNRLRLRAMVRRSRDQVGPD
ncbi:DUF2721 domain-containing protein [Erythrobacter sp. 3-20A1M]|uniref:DUF2721 domain-containing protein n=1 Tax=Erythrobacter sp. 3-20A1M TaxID=2653850 RepID=UPI001BFC9E61|nr:DUF2721 domain-containing protein [Erythrobacter sp. 3-20A1M]QWC56289.1 DUF2721 domain-containing protein [Erythrobacter sp. 3-20A1M]|tara:strand:+ start:577 stop:1095 length:519 start_codon:yes stop_codon:yes gene_type:complete